MKKGICCAGNMIVDITYPIETWPKQNELTHITEGITRPTGGSVCHTISDLPRPHPAPPPVASRFPGPHPTGDFVLRATVWHDFIAAGDACTLMVMDTPTLWAKACFEQTYFGSHTAVSVVPNGLSDDANGQTIIQQEAIPLK